MVEIIETMEAIMEENNFGYMGKIVQKEVIMVEHNTFARTGVIYRGVFNK